MNSNDNERVELYATLAEAKAQFGVNHADFVIKLTRDQVAELLRGQVIAFDINGREYAGFLICNETN